MFKKTKVATDDDMRLLLPRGLSSSPSPNKALKTKTPEHNFVRGFSQFNENRSSKRKYQSLYFLSYLMELCVFNPDVFGSTVDELRNCKQLKECFGDFAVRFVEEIDVTKDVCGVYGGNLIRVFVAAENGVSVAGEMLKDEKIYNYIFSEVEAQGLEQLINLAGIMTRMKFIAYYKAYETNLAVGDFEVTKQINSELFKSNPENIMEIYESMQKKHSVLLVDLSAYLAKAQTSSLDREESFIAGFRIAQLGKSLFTVLKKEKEFFTTIAEHDFDENDTGAEYIFGLSLIGTKQMFILSPEADLTALEALPLELNHLLKEKWEDVKINMMAPAMFPTFN